MTDLRDTQNPLVASSVVYALASGYRIFTPAMILGADRIVITKKEHEAGVKQGFQFGGKTYTGSRLNSLEKGVYFDKNDGSELVQVSADQAGLNQFKANVKSKAFTNQFTYTSDSERSKILDSVIGEWIARNGGPAAQPARLNSSRLIRRVWAKQFG